MNEDIPEIPVRNESNIQFSKSGITKALPYIQLVIWCLLALAVCGLGLFFLLALGGATGAPQEAAAGAIFSTIFIGLYILARCTEKISAILKEKLS